MGETTIGEGGGRVVLRRGSAARTVLHADAYEDGDYGGRPRAAVNFVSDTTLPLNGTLIRQAKSDSNPTAESDSTPASIID